MEKHPCSVAAFFGVVYAGCYYVPIDEEMPRYRVELIFRNLNPRAVLCDEKTRPMIEEMGYSSGLHQEMLFATAVILFLFIFGINLILTKITAKLGDVNVKF